MQAITKKKFQEMLNESDRENRQNEHGNITDGFRNNQYAQRTRLYGDYVRSQDPDMFNDIMRRYLERAPDLIKLDKYL